MKTIKIPSTMIPYRVIVNGKEYVYEAGATVEVPDEVAIAIENSVAAAEDLVKPAPNTSNQPDWNQTDVTAPGFIKNKPFGATYLYAYSGEAYMEYAADFGGAMMEIDPTSYDAEPFYVSVVSGKPIVVTFDGKVYKCATMSNEAAPGYYYFGNLSAIGMEDTGEPFLGVYGSGMIMLADITVTQNVTRDISIAVEAFVRIPYNYLPENIRANERVVLYEEITNGGNTFYLNREVMGSESTRIPLYELKTYVEAGVNIMIKSANSYCLPAVIDMPTNVEYGRVYVYNLLGGNQVYYTAEYTP